MSAFGPRSRDGGIDEVPLPVATGRLWLCGKHVVGPDPEAALASVGAEVVVCLNERHEIDARYPGYVPWLEANAGGRAVWRPIPDLSAPPAEEVGSLLDDLVGRLAAGRGLIVHCGAGIGRAGTVAACLLVRMGVPSSFALETVARHRPMAGPESGTQRELVAALDALRDGVRDTAADNWSA